MKDLFLLLSMSFLVITCSENIAVLHDHQMPPNGWAEGDIIKVEQVQKSTAQELYIRVVHSKEYGYENLYVKMTIGEEDHMISLPLMNDRGLWQGDKSGDLYTYDHPFGHLLHEGAFDISLEQYSRAPILAELKNIQLVQKPSGTASN